MEVEEISPEGKKVMRVKELEKIVKKLEEENKQLLSEVIIIYCTPLATTHTLTVIALRVS